MVTKSTDGDKNQNYGLIIISDDRIEWYTNLAIAMKSQIRSPVHISAVLNKVTDGSSFWLGEWLRSAIGFGTRTAAASRHVSFTPFEVEIPISINTTAAT